MENPWKIHCKMEDMEVLICFHGIFNVKMEDMEVLISFHGFFLCKNGGFSLAMLHADFCSVEAPDSICKMFNFRRNHPGISAEIGYRWHKPSKSEIGGLT
jgi:hypothetical protein